MYVSNFIFGFNSVAFCQKRKRILHNIYFYHKRDNKTNVNLIQNQSFKIKSALFIRFYIKTRAKRDE